MRNITKHLCAVLLTPVMLAVALGIVAAATIVGAYQGVLRVLEDA